ELALLRIELELNERHRRDRSRELGIDRAEQRFGDARELVIELEVHACGQERESLEQPLDVGIVAARGLQQQPRCDLRVALAEFRTETPEIRQLPLVILQ